VDSNYPEHLRDEPTVFGAVRRYPVTVVLVVLISVALALGFELAQQPVFEAQATVTVPPLESAEGQTPEQSLAGQLLLLQSPAAAERAARIANRSLGRTILSAEDFKGDGASLHVVPPDGTTQGTYGANIITVTFTWPDALVAKTGVNSALQAFDEVRSNAIADQGDAAVAAIQRTLEDSRTSGQIGALVNQRAQILVNKAIDLTRHPTVAWATVPNKSLNGDWKRSVAVGLLLGLVLGAAIAYFQAIRRRSFDDPLQPGELYGAPLLGQVPSRLTGPSLVGRFRDAHQANELTMAGAPHGAGAEAFRFVAASVQRLRAHAGDGVSVGFVSAMPNRARSAVVADLALALGESGSSVLAVDADRGKLTAYPLPDCPGEGGFGDVLTGVSTAKHCIRPSPLQSNVAVLPTGTLTARPMAGAAYLSAVERVLDEGKRVHDVVTVDSPAVMENAAAAELAHASAAVVIVISRHEAVNHHQDLLRRLTEVGANVVGYIYCRPPSRSSTVHLPHLMTHTKSWKPSRRTRR